MVPRLRAAGGGECTLDTGPAEDREPAEEDGAGGGIRSGALEEGLERRTRGPPADGEARQTMGPSGGRRDATQT